MQKQNKAKQNQDFVKHTSAFQKIDSMQKLGVNQQA